MPRLGRRHTGGAEASSFGRRRAKGGMDLAAWRGTVLAATRLGALGAVAGIKLGPRAQNDGRLGLESSAAAGPHASARAPPEQLLVHPLPLLLVPGCFSSNPIQSLGSTFSSALGSVWEGERVKEGTQGTRSRLVGEEGSGLRLHNRHRLLHAALSVSERALPPLLSRGWSERSGDCSVSVTCLLNSFLFLLPSGAG
jgi:hypothetical protein